MVRWRRIAVSALSAAVVALLGGTPASSADYIIEPDFANRWCTNATGTNVFEWSVTCMFGGSGSISTNAPLFPTGGGYRLVHSAFGQPQESQKSDFELGEIIAAPQGVDLSSAPGIYPAATAFY